MKHLRVDLSLRAMGTTDGGAGPVLERSWEPGGPRAGSLVETSGLSVNPSQDRVILSGTAPLGSHRNPASRCCCLSAPPSHEL